MGLRSRKVLLLTILLPDARPVYGIQEPTHLLVPPAVSSSAVEAAELAASVGLVLDPWQRLALEASLGETADGRWAAFEFGLEVARQNGKGSVIEARELAGLFLFGEELILHSAHEFKVCSEAFRRLVGWIDGSADLSRRVKRVFTASGKESIELTSGARIRFVARSKGSGRGFTGDLIVLDEAMILSRDAVAAMMPTLSARPNPQIWYTGSAPFAESEVWHSVRRRAMETIESGESGRLAWCGWEAPAGADPADRDVWLATNPAVGYRISPEYLEAEFGALDHESFLRERLSVADSGSAGGHMIDPVVWLSRADRGSVPAGGLVLGVDVQPGSMSAAVGVAGVRVDGVRHVEVIDVRPGTGWVVSRVAEVVSRNRDICAVALDPRSPAGGLLAQLQTVLDVPVVEVGSAGHGQAVASLLQHVANGSVAHLGQPLLDAAVEAARPRRMGDAQAFSRSSSDANIAPLVAVTLALGELEDRQADPVLMPFDSMVATI